MKRKINVLHYNGEGHTLVFEWETRKKGLTNDVVSYIIEKFQNPAEYPAKYDARPLEKGDRLELVLLEGNLAGTKSVFELVSSNSFRQL